MAKLKLKTAKSNRINPATKKMSYAVRIITNGTASAQTTLLSPPPWGRLRSLEEPLNVAPASQRGATTQSRRWCLGGGFPSISL